MDEYESKAEQRGLNFIRWGGIVYLAILLAYLVRWFLVHTA